MGLRRMWDYASVHGIRRAETRHRHRLRLPVVNNLQAVYLDVGVWVVLRHAQTLQRESQDNC